MLRKHYRVIPAVILLALIIAQTPQPAAATTLSSGFSESQFISGLNAPTSMAFAPDGRLFITQQGGRLRVVKNGALLADSFLRVTVDSTGERGLLGVAFDPAFETNNYLYVYYTTDSTPRRNRVSRFTANGDVAVDGSEVILLELDDLSSATNHNGGALHFGSDGKLYIAVGDNARGSNSQTLSNLLGKVLRMNTDGTIPADNPFYGSATGKNRLIWALGLRNPFTFSVDPLTDQVFINDVGQGTWEEINDGAAGRNFGWPTTEGDFNQSSYPAFTRPVYTYESNNGPCAITGGVFYRPSVSHFPADYVGDYFFADYCADWIRRYNIENGSISTFASATSGSIVDLDVGPDGMLYYLARDGSKVMRISYASALPTITQNPFDVTAAQGEPATFTCEATSGTPVSYKWTRDNIDIPGATSNSYTLSSAQLSDSGAAFRCVATNSAGSATSDPAVLTVLGNQPPVPVINTPVNGSFYSAGDVISFSGSATDPEDGAIPASNLTWLIDFHHDEHTHPAMGETSGISSGTFTTDSEGHPETTVWYRIYLTATDSEGLSQTVYHEFFPRLVQLSIASNTPELTITVNGQPFTPPYTFPSVIGAQHELNAPSPQMNAHGVWQFESWSDGGAAFHDITAPAANTTYTVNWSLLRPLVPVLSSPSNNHNTSDSSPTFRWNEVDFALNYELMVDDDADWGSPALEIETTQRQFTPTLLLPGTYQWRVRSISEGDAASEWSAPYTLTIFSTSGAVPELNLTGDETPELRWNRLTWADDYEIQVDNNNSFTSLEFTAIVDETVLEISASELIPGRYYWRARGLRDGGAPGAWSAPGTFIIGLP